MTIHESGGKQAGGTAKQTSARESLFILSLAQLW
jgi:hypothetical protein